MKILIDACVLYPTVLREITLGAAARGAFTPLWSDRILEEWRRAALKNDPATGSLAEGEILMAKTHFPDALVAVNPETEARLFLPDSGDEHVLAAAIDGGAEAILTLNLKDFPTNALAAEGLLRRAPDEFLIELYHADPDGIRDVVSEVIARAARYGIKADNPRGLLKKARLPRLGKALYPKH